MRALGAGSHEPRATQLSPRFHCSADPHHLGMRASCGLNANLLLSLAQVECEGRGSFTVYSAGFDAEAPSEGATGLSCTTAVCLHGAGSCGCSWALTSRLLKTHCRVIAMDLRGHGSTITHNDAGTYSERRMQGAVRACRCSCKELPCLSCRFHWKTYLLRLL